MPRQTHTALLPLALPALALLTLSACASEWESEVVFPEGFRDTYVKLHGCEASQHPAAEYVVTWMSPDAKAAMDQFTALPANSSETTIAWPEGMILVKAQYDDDKCQQLKEYTAMQKLPTGAAEPAGDWKWQHVGKGGECLNCDNGTACSGCHSQSKCNGFVCTRQH